VSDLLDLSHRGRAGRALGQDITTGTDAATEPDEGGYSMVTQRNALMV
jgi:hypothetical protein